MVQTAGYVLSWALLVVAGCWAASILEIVAVHRGTWSRQSSTRLGVLTTSLIVPAAALTWRQPWVGALALLTVSVSALLVAVRHRPAVEDPAEPGGAVASDADEVGHDEPGDHQAPSAQELGPLQDRWPGVRFAMARSTEATVVSWADGPPAPDVARECGQACPGERIHTRRSYTPETTAQLLITLADAGEWSLLAWPAVQQTAADDRTWITDPGDDARQMAIISGQSHGRALTYSMWRALQAVRPEVADRPEFADPVLETDLALAARWPQTVFTMGLQVDCAPVLSIAWTEGPTPEQVRELLDDVVPGITVWTDRHTAQV